MAWPVFPQCPAYGFTKRADYSVTIVERSNGVRSVNRNWYYPLHTITAVPMGERFEEDIHTVQRFWHAVGGQAGQFLFTDYTDYKSTDRLEDDPSPLDQPLVINADSPGGFQLTKVYSDDEFNFSQYRIISKPRQGTIQIAIDGVTAAEGVDYWLDYETGLAVFSGLSGDEVLTWGGEFYLPVMFETVPEFMITNRRIQQTAFALRELRIAA